VSGDRHSLLGKVMKGAIAAMRGQRSTAGSSK
jgi:predicted aconitase with swiveling domain